MQVAPAASAAHRDSKPISFNNRVARTTSNVFTPGKGHSFTFAPPTFSTRVFTKPRSSPPEAVTG
jgi:hypothetical protein